jgi:NhaA family Na+:H+ antiporter
MKLTILYKEFFNSEKAGGLILVFVTIISMIIANSSFQDTYVGFWNYDISGHTLAQWINDGLMTVFFLLIGLELEREIYHGELKDIKSAALPIFGALGGMAVPAGIYMLINYGTDTQSGTGIPTATDIAFAIGILSLLGNKVPSSLKIFLTALAVIDDLGAIIIISIFYSKSIALTNLFIALGIFVVLLVFNRLKIRNLVPYLIGGAAIWYFMLHSGVHATITGVLLAFAIPFGNGDEKSPSYILQHFLHKPVAFFVLPVFAMANTCIPFGGDLKSGLLQAASLGIIAGLIFGKPLGIWLFSFIGVKLRICSLPTELKWKNIIGVGFLGGIGFTMSIFIALLAFENSEIINYSKIAIIIGSLLAGTIGFIILKSTLKVAVDDD